jgi:hypothetical protein
VSETKEEEHVSVHVVMLALVPAVIWWDGYVLAKLWGWHVAPAFGLPELEVGVACGITLIMSHLTHQLPQTADKRTSAESTARLVGMATRAAFALFAGWICS